MTNFSDDARVDVVLVVAFDELQEVGVSHLGFGSCPVGLLAEVNHHRLRNGTRTRQRGGGRFATAIKATAAQSRSRWNARTILSPVPTTSWKRFERGIPKNRTHGPHKGKKKDRSRQAHHLENDANGRRGLIEAFDLGDSGFVELVHFSKSLACGEQTTIRTKSHENINGKFNDIIRFEWTMLVKNQPP
jgi:hypothetical protein